MIYDIPIEYTTSQLLDSAFRNRSSVMLIGAEKFTAADISQALRTLHDKVMDDPKTAIFTGVGERSFILTSSVPYYVVGAIRTLDLDVDWPQTSRDLHDELAGFNVTDPLELLPAETVIEIIMSNSEVRR